MSRLSASDLDDLCRWLNARTTDLPPPFASIYGGWSRADVRDHLVQMTCRAVTERVLGEAAVDTWRKFWGIGCPALGRKELAEQTGVVVTAVYQRRRRVAALLADRLQSTTPVPPEPNSAKPLDPETALATLYAGLVVEDSATPARLSAIYDLRRRELQHSMPAHFDAVSKHARHRARLDLAGRLDRLQADGLAREPVTRSTGDDGELARRVAFFDPRYWANDTDLPAELIDVRHCLRRRPNLLSARTEASFWSVQARIWREDEDIGTVWAAHRIRTLAGSQTAASVAADDDAAIVLAAHGFLFAATAMVEDALRRIPVVRAEMSQRRQMAISLLARQAVLRAQLMLTHPRPGDADAAHRALDACMRLLDEDDRTGDWAAVVYRRRLQVLGAAAVRERRRDGYRQGLVLPRSLDGLLDQGDDHAALTGRDLWRFTWHLTVLELSLERNDPEMFHDRLRQVATGLEDAPWLFANQANRLRLLLDRVNKRRGRWKSMSLPTIPVQPIRTPEHWDTGVPLRSTRLRLNS